MESSIIGSPDAGFTPISAVEEAESESPNKPENQLNLLQIICILFLYERET